MSSKFTSKIKQKKKQIKLFCTVFRRVNERNFTFLYTALMFDLLK